MSRKIDNQEEYLTKSEIAQVKRNKRIREVFFVNIIVFGALFLYVGYMGLEHKDIAYSTYNSRTTYDNMAVWRGDILSQPSVLTSSGAVLATTTEDGIRQYPQGPSVAHTIGYYDYGRVGLENIYGVELEKVNFEVLKYFTYMLGAELKGNNVVTTIDIDLQNYIYDNVKTQKAAVVVLDAKTGDILSMVSTPSFDPNNIKQDWDWISTDEVNTPLLNRTIQGKYPPGSTFKVITALSFMRNNPEYENYVHNCTGAVTIGDTTISCFNNTVHGEVNLEQALKVSCNTYFASLVEELKTKELEKTANDLLFNESLDFILPYTNSSFGFGEEDEVGDYMRTYIGQGDTLVTPLFMAQIFQAIANDGVMLTPHLVDEIQSAGGLTVDDIKTKKIKRVMSVEEANILTEYMKGVCQAGGTASNLADLPFQVAGKTGSAENGHGEDHGWFVGFAPADDPEVVICALYENNAGSHYMLGDMYKFFSRALR